ncbi:MAG TPA: DNA-processing protein DprA, partial [Candidatus Eisenbacteria bacterium]|nr:DNA-processing protein DprA [Candidatus Eisenbacteria bacterium]
MIVVELSSERRSPSAASPEADFALWVALSRVKGLGCVGFKKLASHFASPIDVFSAAPAELQSIKGLEPEVIVNLAHFSGWKEAGEEVRRALDAGIKLVPFTDPVYPARLRAIADPPPVLYVKGSLEPEDERAVAIVGSRSASEYGRGVARDLARDLCALGFTVVSGMARGIDGTAHEAALEAGG